MGESAVRDVYAPAEEESLHEKVVREFAEAQVVPGNPKFGVVVGELAESELEKYDWNWRNFAKRMVEKEIDLVMENPEKDWIVEVNRNLRLIMLKKDWVSFCSMNTFIEPRIHRRKSKKHWFSLK